jgi:hypothetical protein
MFVRHAEQLAPEVKIRIIPPGDTIVLNDLLD